MLRDLVLPSAFVTVVGAAAPPALADVRPYFSAAVGGTFHVGVRRAFAGGYTLWARGGPSWGVSSAAGRSYVSPSLSFGMTWSFQDVWSAAPPRPVKNPGMTVAAPGGAASAAAAAARVVASAGPAQRPARPHRDEAGRMPAPSGEAPSGEARRGDGSTSTAATVGISF